MNDVIDRVRDHYRAIGLTDRLKAALTVFGPEHEKLNPKQLAALRHATAFNSEPYNARPVTFDQCRPFH